MLSGTLLRTSIVLLLLINLGSSSVTTENAQSRPLHVHNDLSEISARQFNHIVLADGRWKQIICYARKDGKTILTDKDRLARLQDGKDPRRPGLRLQPLFPSRMSFPCANATKGHLARSPKVPTSVHRLRPGDIAVIAAMGDSLVAGNGALEEFAIGTLIEHRGVSWCAGGQGDWRQYLTLPNILKEFNPNLRGYSTGDGEFLTPNAQLNVAFPVSADADAVRQAALLVRRMKKHPNVDFKNDWKMITLLFGANDLCSGQCFDPMGTSAVAHARKLRDALDYLHQHVPRAFVNLVPVIDPSVSMRVRRSLMCRVLHRFFCQCFHTSNGLEHIITLAKEYQCAEEILIRSGRYDTRDDFTVVLQPFSRYFNAPADPAKQTTPSVDISYVTYDCFHFSQKGHALAANMLWNNLLEPIGRKSQYGMIHVLDEFRCPSHQAPYFFTYKNSRIFFKTGSQDGVTNTKQGF